MIHSDVVPESDARHISLMTRPAFLLSRRRSLRRAGLLSGAVVTAPLTLRQALLGADAPGKKIHIGMIGMGRQALAAQPAALPEVARLRGGRRLRRGCLAAGAGRRRRGSVLRRRKRPGKYKAALPTRISGSCSPGRTSTR